MPLRPTTRTLRLSMRLRRVKSLNVSAGTDKRFIYTSGSLVYGSTGDTSATEDTPLNPVEMVRWRQALEREILAAGTEGVHPVVIRPAWVYGNWGGAAMMMVAAAKEHGAALLSVTVKNRWSTVHADDLADLYALALERAPADPSSMARTVRRRGSSRSHAQRAS